jgi:hypothetical protein
VLQGEDAQVAEAMPIHVLEALLPHRSHSIAAPALRRGSRLSSVRFREIQSKCGIGMSILSLEALGLAQQAEYGFHREQVPLVDFLHTAEAQLLRSPESRPNNTKFPEC